MHGRCGYADTAPHQYNLIDFDHGNCFENFIAAFYEQAVMFFM
jgi:hypothetical protein